MTISTALIHPLDKQVKRIKICLSNILTLWLIFISNVAKHHDGDDDVFAGVSALFSDWIIRNGNTYTKILRDDSTMQFLFKYLSECTLFSFDQESSS